MEERFEYPRVSVIVPVKNGEPWLEGCLGRLQAQRYPAGRLEIIMADNGSTDRSAEIGARRGVVVVPAATPGPSAARNAALRRATGDLLLFTDVDCLVDDEWVLRHALTHLYFQAIDPRVQVVGGGIAGVNRSVWAVCDDLCSWANQNPSLPARRLPRFLATANLSATRRVIEEVGGFDEELLCGEDVAFCAAARQRGFGLHFQPAARVRHVNRTSLREFLGHPASWTRVHPKLFERRLQGGPDSNRAIRAVFRLPLLRDALVVPIALVETAKTVLYALRAGRFECLPLLPFILANKAVFAAGYYRSMKAYFLSKREQARLPAAGKTDPAGRLLDAGGDPSRPGGQAQGASTT